MSAFELVLIAVLLATALATVGAAVTRRPRVARVAGVLGAVTAASGFIAVVASLARAYAATTHAGLNQADRQRIWSNGVAEALYNAFFVVIVAVAAFGVARWIENRKPMG